MRSWPWERRRAATAEESTPPDIATAIVLLGDGFMFDRDGYPLPRTFLRKVFERLNLGLDHVVHQVTLVREMRWAKFAIKETAGPALREG